MIVDLKHPVESSTDQTRLAKIFSALVGQPFLKAEFSYADELKVHFGSPVSYTSPKLVAKTKGSWRIATRGSHWRFFLSSVGLSIDSEPTLPSNDDIEKAVGAALAGKIVSQAALPFMPALSGGERGVGVGLMFEDESTFNLWPNAELDDDDQKGEPIADWELFTPFGMYLRVGPGLVWQYLSANTTVATV